MLNIEMVTVIIVHSKLMTRCARKTPIGQYIERGMCLMKKYERIVCNQIYRFIRDYHKTYQYAPSTQEIAMGVGVSLPTASRYINRMLERGELETDHKGQPRCLRVGDING